MHTPHRLRAHRERTRERGTRRDHDRALADPRVAAEHRVAAGRARARGNPGCVYCDGDGGPSLASRLFRR
jgi:hypothetical protein